MNPHLKKRWNDLRKNWNSTIEREQVTPDTTVQMRGDTVDVIGQSVVLEGSFLPVVHRLEDLHFCNKFLVIRCGVLMHLRSQNGAML